MTAAAVGAPRPPESGSDGPRAERTFLRVAALGTALRLALVWSGWTDATLVPDDAYYYFTLARNAAAGQGITFDGLAPTNGFHPLWLALLTPVFALARALHTGPWFPIRAALSLAAALELFTGWVVFRRLTELGHPRGATWFAALWFLFPTGVMLGLDGLESPVVMAAFALHAWVFLGLARGGHLGARGGAALGAATGLAFLARTDNGVFMPLVVVAETLVLAASGVLSWRRLPGFLAACAATTVLVASPWLIWNWVTFHSIVQSSAAIKSLSPMLGGNVRRLELPGLPDFAGPAIACFSFLWRPVRLVLDPSAPWGFQVALTAAIAGSLALLAPPLVRRLAGAAGPAERAFAAGLAVYLVAHMLVYGLIVRFYATWYAALPTMIAWILFVGLGADAPLAAAPRSLRRAVAAALIVVGGALYVYFFVVTGISPGKSESQARWGFRQIAAHAPGVRTIGCYHGWTGVWGYFAPRFGPYRIVNLDGLVNNQAVSAVREGRYYEYLERTLDLVVVNVPAPFEYNLGPQGVERFYRRFPRWPENPWFFGPPAGRPSAPGSP